jgi:hypothetical protein
MIDIKVRYQAVVFMPGIEANQSNISQMMGLFADKGLVPTTFQEMSIATLFSQLQFALQSPDNEWNIRFGVDRIDISKNATDKKGSNIGTIEQFCADVTDNFLKIISKHTQKANRIALSSNVFLKEIAEDESQAVYLKFLKPIKIYSENIPNEWTSKMVARVPKQLNSTIEIFNFITDISKINGHFNLNKESIPVDRIAINMDINSIPNNTINRFGEAEIIDFYKNSPVWHNEVTGEILNKIKQIC